MSQANPPRALSAPEELERLEQSITLTLQEIDSNFSKAHRIVTGSILSVVEQYGKHSNDVWEGSKFWKQFFEASANVSLSNYEEPALDNEATQTDTTATIDTPSQHEERSAVASDLRYGDDEDFTVDSPTQVTGLQTTPQLPPSTARKASGTSKAPAPSSAAVPFRSPSPRKYTGKNPLAEDPSPRGPSTPQSHAKQRARVSPSKALSAFEFPLRQRADDPLMHRVLDKTYRIQATPHTQRRRHQQPPHGNPTPSATATKKSVLWDESPQSSPAMAAPQLSTELFSPAKRAARVPGVSVLTPARKTGYNAPLTSTGRQLFSPQDKAYASGKDRTSRLFDEDSDEDDGLADMSPPKTMQFHIPQSRLLQTPAREASRRIVEDLLLTAGVDVTDEIEGEEEGFEDEQSPSVVRKAFNAEDDTF